MTLSHFLSPVLSSAALCPRAPIYILPFSHLSVSTSCLLPLSHPPALGIRLSAHPTPQPRSLPCSPTTCPIPRTCLPALNFQHLITVSPIISSHSTPGTAGAPSGSVPSGAVNGRSPHQQVEARARHVAQDPGEPRVSTTLRTCHASQLDEVSTRPHFTDEEKQPTHGYTARKRQNQDRGSGVCLS